MRAPCLPCSCAVQPHRPCSDHAALLSDLVQARSAAGLASRPTTSRPTSASSGRASAACRRRSSTKVRALRTSPSALLGRLPDVVLTLRPLLPARRLYRAQNALPPPVPSRAREPGRRGASLSAVDRRRGRGTERGAAAGRVALPRGVPGRANGARDRVRVGLSTLARCLRTCALTLPFCRRRLLAGRPTASSRPSSRPSRRLKPTVRSSSSRRSRCARRSRHL